MRITKFLVASAVLLAATAVRADGPGATPALPLPDVSSTWNTSAPPAGVVSTSYNASYDGQQAATVAPNTTQAGPPAPVSDDSSPAVASMPSCQAQPSCGCQGGCGEGCCGGCSPFGGRGYGAGCDCCCNPWYGYVGGLVMGRNQANKYWTTYNEVSNADQVLNTDNASAHWGGGGEFTIGRCLGCDNRIEATYWGIWNMHGSASITDPNNLLGTPMDTTNGGVMIGTQTADSFFTNAHEALIQRNDQVNNVEINFCYNPNGADIGCGMTSTWVAGFRYFRFDEDLLWTSVAGGFTLGEDGGADQANLEIRSKNDLAGFQVGNCLNWKFCNRASVYLGTKAGVYGNDAQTTSSLYSGSGVSGFVYHGQKEDVAFIGQADLGLNYDIGCRWSATVGYRVVFATGLALADEQIPFYLAGQSDFQDVKTNGDLVLNGGFAGISFCW
jgi:hypothetical protein